MLRGRVCTYRAVFMDVASATSIDSSSSSKNAITFRKRATGRRGEEGKGRVHVTRKTPMNPPERIATCGHLTIDLRHFNTCTGRRQSSPAGRRAGRDARRRAS